jgi:hypothetical protein
MTEPSTVELALCLGIGLGGLGATFAALAWICDKWEGK